MSGVASRLVSKRGVRIGGSPGFTHDDGTSLAVPAVPAVPATEPEFLDVQKSAAAAIIIDGIALIKNVPILDLTMSASAFCLLRRAFKCSSCTGSDEVVRGTDKKCKGRLRIIAFEKTNTVNFMHFVNIFRHR